MDMTIPEHSYAVILAGGGGTRLWPKSRKAHPKHLLKLFGDKTMLQLTFDRSAEVVPVDRIFVITHQAHAKEALKQLPELKKENLIVEPMARNTALAMGVAAAFIRHRDPEAVIGNFAADHIIEKIRLFKRAAVAALHVVSTTDNIVAVGVRPTYAHTGLGYIRVGKQLEEYEEAPVFKSRGFKEKPDLTTAQSFIASGQYLWNANYYFWSVKTVFENFEKYCPQVAQSIEKISQHIGKADEKEVMQKVYEQAQDISIDYAVSEKAEKLAVVPGDFDWSDVGDWKVIYDMGEKDERDNVVSLNKDHFIGIDTKRCLIEPNGRLIVTIGLEDIVVVDTPDATLICRKDRTQDVKKAVEKLKELKKEEYL